MKYRTSHRAIPLGTLTLIQRRKSVVWPVGYRLAKCLIFQLFRILQMITLQKMSENIRGVRVCSNTLNDERIKNTHT